MEKEKQRRTDKPITIAENIYWVGSNIINKGLGCNPYLIIDDGIGILIDPGSVLDYEIVQKNVESLIDLSRIKYILLHHQDPDFCSSVPLFEKAGVQAQIVTHWRTSVFVQYYGVASSFYAVDENNYSLVLPSGRKLRFIPTPYLHFPGSIVTWDEASGILFSSDLFGAFGDHENLYADVSYQDGLITFHEHYMPSNAILRDAMLKIENLPLKLIAPQHGCIINSHFEKYLRILKNLECGLSLQLGKKDLNESGGYEQLCSTILYRIKNMYTFLDWKKLTDSIGLTVDPQNMEILDHSYDGPSLWNRFFEALFMELGINSLTVLEPMITKFTQIHDIPYPNIFHSQLFHTQQQLEEKDKENERLTRLTTHLEENLAEAQRKITQDDLTGLKNESFFRYFLNASQTSAPMQNSDPFLIFLTIDRFQKMLQEMGRETTDEIITSTAYALSHIIPGDPEKNIIQLYRLQGPKFAIYLPETQQEEATALARTILTQIRENTSFIQPITVSIGVLCLGDLMGKFKNDKPETEILRTGFDLLIAAQQAGGNTIVRYGDTIEIKHPGKKVFIVDEDSYFSHFLQQELVKKGIESQILTDGETALKAVSTEMPDLIISELNLPVLSGLTLRKNLLFDPRTKQIPFILASHKKKEKDIIEAYRLGIRQYLQKPVSFIEMISLIESIVETDDQ